jgi:hypothetical protein
MASGNATAWNAAACEECAKKFPKQGAGADRKHTYMYLGTRVFGYSLQAYTHVKNSPNVRKSFVSIQLRGVHLRFPVYGVLADVVDHEKRAAKPRRAGHAPPVQGFDAPLGVHFAKRGPGVRVRRAR